MDEDLHNIEDLFRSSLDDNEDEVPSRNVWNAVDKRLDKDNIISIKRKYSFLKRIAILLLLLLSISLYELNTNYKINNGLAKNNNNNADSQTQSNKKRDKDINNRIPPNATLAIDTARTDVAKKQNTLKKSAGEDNQELTNLQPVNKDSRYPSQKESSNETTNAEKDISKTQVSRKLTQKKKISTGPASRIKIKNAKPTEDEQPLVRNNDPQVDNQLPSLRKLKIASIEKLKLKPADSIDIKKIFQPIASSKVNVYDSSNKAVSKTTAKKSGNPSRFSITPFLSPDIAWYRLKDDKVDNRQDNASEIEREEKHEFSSTFGALADYKINKHWGLQTGFTFSNTNITVQPKTIYAQPDNTGSVKYRINTSSGYGYVLPSYISNPSIGDSLYAFTSSHSLHYIGIPMAVTYNVTKGKFKLNALAGIATNILTRAKLETSVENGIDNSIETVDNMQGLKKVYLSGLAGIGVDYKLSNKTALTFAPVMRFAVNSINKDATVKSYPMSFGFVVGLKAGL